MGDATVLDREGEFALLYPIVADRSDRAGTGGAVARTLAVLRALSRLGPNEHPLMAIAESAELPAATVHRYLQALVREGAVEQRGPRARYALAEAPRDPYQIPQASSMSPIGQTSPSMRAELVTLQSRTGQIALVFRPHLFGVPMRICAERAIGAHAEELRAIPRETIQHLEIAPLEADPAGLAILACLGVPSLVHTSLSAIREDGHAVGKSPLPGRDMIAAPLWYGSAAAGAVAVLPSSSQMRSATARARFVSAVMDTAAAMSRQLTRTASRRAG